MTFSDKTRVKWGTLLIETILSVLIETIQSGDGRRHAT